MTKFPCPHCNKLTISLKQKYLAGKWFNIHCDACLGRSCAQPIILALMSFLYVWNVFYFSVVAYLERSWYFVGILIVLWLILDYFCHYIPLQRMKSPNKKPPVAADDEPADLVFAQPPAQPPAHTSSLNKEINAEQSKKLEDS